MLGSCAYLRLSQRRLGQRQRVGERLRRPLRVVHVDFFGSNNLQPLARGSEPLRAHLLLLVHEVVELAHLQLIVIWCET